MFVNGPIWLAATVSGSTVKKKKKIFPLLQKFLWGSRGLGCKLCENSANTYLFNIRILLLGDAQ